MFEVTDMSPKYLVELFEMLQTNLPLVNIFIHTSDPPLGRYCTHKQLSFINKTHSYSFKSWYVWKNSTKKKKKKRGLAGFIWNNISLHKNTDQKACRSLHFQGKSVSINIKITELRNLQYPNDVGSFAVMSLFSDTTHEASLWNMPDMSILVETRNGKVSSNPLLDSVHTLLDFWFLVFVFWYEM